jgi:hypothetical protein
MQAAAAGPDSSGLQEGKDAAGESTPGGTDTAVGSGGNTTPGACSESESMVSSGDSRWLQDGKDATPGGTDTAVGSGGNTTPGACSESESMVSSGDSSGLQDGKDATPGGTDTAVGSGNTTPGACSESESMVSSGDSSGLQDGKDATPGGTDTAVGSGNTTPGACSESESMISSGDFSGLQDADESTLGKSTPGTDTAVGLRQHGRIYQLIILKRALSLPLLVLLCRLSTMCSSAGGLVSLRRTGGGAAIEQDVRLLPQHDLLRHSLDDIIVHFVPLAIVAHVSHVVPRVDGRPVHHHPREAIAAIGVRVAALAEGGVALIQRQGEVVLADLAHTVGEAIEVQHQDIGQVDDADLLGHHTLQFRVT